MKKLTAAESPARFPWRNSKRCSKRQGLPISQSGIKKGVMILSEAGTSGRE